MESKLNVLLIGGSGKEAAMAWKLLQSPRLGQLFTAPHYFPGTVCATGIDPMDADDIIAFVQNHAVDFVVLGSAKEIVAGIADALTEAEIPVVGPNAACGQLEGSKEFAKEFMFNNAIPTARFMTVTEETADEGLAFLDSLPGPYVLKADGLAGGKGVVITESLADAKDIMGDMIEGLFGNASSTVVIEEFLPGEECSVFLAVDGSGYRLLPTAHDFKRVGEGDCGPNTAGMGAISPSAIATPEFMEKVESRIIRPTLRGLKDLGMEYRGFLYLGVIESEGEPLLLEYNVRLGDPEAQAILPRMDFDFLELLHAMTLDRVAEMPTGEFPLASAAVVVAAQGYPTDTVKGNSVSGIEDAMKAGCLVFKGSIVGDALGREVNTGGRILTVAALSDTPEKASEKAMAGAELIKSDGCFFRKDIR